MRINFEGASARAREDDEFPARNRNKRFHSADAIRRLAGAIGCAGVLNNFQRKQVQGGREGGRRREGKEGRKIRVTVPRVGTEYPLASCRVSSLRHRIVIQL